MSATVVVVSYRPTEWLGRCLESVATQADDILVVDNGSPDAAASTIARRYGARLVRLPENIGFAGGVDAGIRAATCDLVAVLNDDAIAPAGWIESAAGVLADPSVAAVGPKIVLEGSFAEIVLEAEEWHSGADPRPLGEQLQEVSFGNRDVLADLIGGLHRVEHDGDRRWRWSAGGRRPIYLKLGHSPSTDGTLPSAGNTRRGTRPKRAMPLEEPIEFTVNGATVASTRTVRLINSAGVYLRPDGYAGDIGDSIADDGQFDQPRECFGLTGAALAARRQVFERVGGIASHFFAYYEDTDWCWRARLCGLRLLYDPSVTVTHVRGQTSGGTTGHRVQYLAERNRLLCLLRNAPLELARRQVREKRRGGGDDGVAEELWRWTPVGLAGRLANRRRWELTPADVYERWAGVDVPV